MTADRTALVDSIEPTIHADVVHLFDERPVLREL